MSTYAPASHAADPATSFEAEAAITASGLRASNMAAVLRTVLTEPGLVGTEVGERTFSRTGTSLGQHEAMRRLADLRAKGLVQQGEARTVPRRKKQVTWWGVVEPIQLPMEMA